MHFPEIESCNRFFIDTDFLLLEDDRNSAQFTTEEYIPKMNNECLAVFVSSCRILQLSCPLACILLSASPAAD